jgi:hypothetical protein
MELTHQQIIAFLIKERDFHYKKAYDVNFAESKNASLICFDEIEYLLRCIDAMENEKEGGT